MLVFRENLTPRPGDAGGEMESDVRTRERTAGLHFTTRITGTECEVAMRLKDKTHYD